MCRRFAPAPASSKGCRRRSSSPRRTIRCATKGEAYARKLKEAGVSVDAVRYNGTIHDFVALNALRHVPSTEAAIDQINAGLRSTSNWQRISWCDYDAAANFAAASIPHE